MKKDKKHLRVETNDNGKVSVVMREFKEGDLRSSSGQKVTNRKQAVAIALSEQRRANRHR